MQVCCGNCRLPTTHKSGGARASRSRTEAMTQTLASWGRRRSTVDWGRRYSLGDKEEQCWVTRRSSD